MVITDLHKLTGPLEIKERDIREIELDHHAIRLVDTIVRLLHDHGLQLVVGIRRGLVLASRERGPEDEVGVERLFHRLDREIVINAAIEDRDAVLPDRLEKEGESHRGPDRFA